MSAVYHHTDTARLPWILRSGELRPGANKIGGFPDPDFLWATTDGRGDLTASADRGDTYRAGMLRHVRFTFDSDRFFPWADVPARHPEWTALQIFRLERLAGGKSDPSSWWCRVGPIALSECVSIETRSYRDNRWRPFDPTATPFSFPYERDEWLAVRIGNTAFGSVPRNVLGNHGYQVLTFKLAAEEQAA